MSKTYEKVGKGSLFNEDTGGNDKKPALKGKVEIAGKEFGVAGWPRMSKANARYVSLQFHANGDTRAVQGDGALFLREVKNPKAPRMTGPAEILGRKFALSVWPQKADSGLEYYSMKIEVVTEDEDGGRTED